MGVGLRVLLLFWRRRGSVSG